MLIHIEREKERKRKRKRETERDGEKASQREREKKRGEVSSTTSDVTPKILPCHFSALVTCDEVFAFPRFCGWSC